MVGVTKPILIMKVGIKSFPFRFRKAQEVIDACTTTALIILILIIDNHRKQRARSTYTAHLRSEESRVGKACDSQCIFRWSPYHENITTIQYQIHTSIHIPIQSDMT